MMTNLRTLSIKMSITVFGLFATSDAGSFWDKTIEPTSYQSIDLLTTRRLDINAIGAEYRFGKLITRSKVLSTTLINEPGIVASYNAIPQFFLFFGGNFNAYPKESDWLIQSVFNLFNGDTGYEWEYTEAGITNSIDLFFTRRAYHRAGIYFCFGTKFKAKVSIYEEDRFRENTPKIGVGFSVVRKIDSLSIF